MASASIRQYRQRRDKPTWKIGDIASEAMRIESARNIKHEGSPPA